MFGDFLLYKKLIKNTDKHGNLKNLMPFTGNIDIISLFFTVDIYSKTLYTKTDVLNQLFYIKSKKV